MEPLTLIALVSAAGFIFKKISSQSKKDIKDKFSKDISYSKDKTSQIEDYKLAEHEISSIEVLPEYDLVKKLILNNFPITFVTGSAGTGKSTFIKWIVHEFDGAVLLGAPTGIAAINIGGKTLHSLCQLPPSWITKKDIKYVPHRQEITNAKLLIIDEISMVTSNLLDGVSAFFRKNRNIDKSFGGIPVILVGDMFQLPPVTNSSTKDLFLKNYGTPKFYNARCLENNVYYAVELKKTFRQSDQEFVDLLSKIREGVDLDECLKSLNSKVEITDNPPEGSVWLSPRNSEVNKRNEIKLNQIHSEQQIFKGTLQGQFKTGRVPSPLKLLIKREAQVIFTKNDKDKRWINGSIGIVKDFTDDTITIKLSDSGVSVDVHRVSWPEYKYLWNRDTKSIDRKEIGHYTQFPVTLAWAITIHKSQGKTIEKVHIDLGSGAFETGQVYVALSRCRDFSGLSMSRPLHRNDILIDQESKNFYLQLRSIIKKLPPEQMQNQLHQSHIFN